MRNGRDVGEELVDIAIYLMGLSEILRINLEDEVNKKINGKRKYEDKDGVLIKI